MNSTEILNSLQLSLTIRRLCFQLIENHHDFSNTVLVGLQPNGVFLVNRLKKELEKIINKVVKTGALDITFFRDDFRRNKDILLAAKTDEKVHYICDKLIRDHFHNFNLGGGQ